MPPIFQSLPLWFQLTLVAVPAFSAIFAASALVLNICQSSSTNAQARAALVAGCLKEFSNDEDIQRAFYAIEYDEFVYDTHFHKSDEERELTSCFATLQTSRCLGKVGF